MIVCGVARTVVGAKWCRESDFFYRCKNLCPGVDIGVRRQKAETPNNDEAASTRLDGVLCAADAGGDDAGTSSCSTVYRRKM